MSQDAHQRSGAGGDPLAGLPAAAQRGGVSPLALIHTNYSPNPVSMRVTARFESSEGLPLELLTDGATAVAWLLGWRAAHAAKSTA